MTDPRPLYREHLRQILAGTERALESAASEGARFDGLLLHSGSRGHYHAQDREVDFRPVPHFARFVPTEAPDQLLLLRPGVRPRLVRCVARDFWYERPAEPEHPWREAIDAVEVDSLEAARDELGSLRGLAYVGNDPEVAGALGIDSVEPQPLMARLDWSRSEKTAYEVECIREAARIAGVGHAAARNGADDLMSERQIHAAYLAETGMLERDTPYTNIVAWDDRSAILHYGSKRASVPSPGHVFLIDAGATAWGYASDITRTYAGTGTHPVFGEVLRAMQTLQRELVAAVRPGIPYVELHERAARGVCRILSRVGVLRVDADTAFECGLSYPFLPHGVGHHLGLQVHDVAGQQAGPTGGVKPPPAQFPYLRTTRELAPGQVVTVEPGLYFIPMLLEKHRGSPDFDWDLVDALVPCGGIRIEDDVVVTADGGEDLSRPFVP